MGDQRTGSGDSWVTFLDPLDGLSPRTWPTTGTTTRSDAEAAARALRGCHDVRVHTRSAAHEPIWQADGLPHCENDGQAWPCWTRRQVAVSDTPEEKQ